MRASGVAVVYVSHRLGEVDSLADRIVVLREGMIRGDQVAPFDWHRAVLDMLGEQVVVQLDELEERRGAEIVLNIEGARLLPHAAPLARELGSGDRKSVV